jgi:hypothetical protein
MTGKRMSGNLLRHMTCQPEWFMPNSEQTVFLGDEEGAIQDV